MPIESINYRVTTDANGAVINAIRWVNSKAEDITDMKELLTLKHICAGLRLLDDGQEIKGVGKRISRELFWVYKHV